MTDDEAAASPLAALLRQQLPGLPAHDCLRFVKSLARPEPYAPWDGWRGQHGVPEASVSAGRHVGSGVYPGVERDYWVYVPQQYDAATPARLMVFQDGARYLGAEINTAQVLDALIHRGDMPVTIAVFVQPGETGPGLPLFGGADNRSVEYDATGGAYARFLEHELLPQALAGYKVSAEAADRAIVGLSSGGMCAFNAAWERPDLFGKVISHCGSFVDIRGGHEMAAKVRRADAKPLRVFLQSGSFDLDITFGNWELANRTLASALAYRGYAHQLVIGEGGHSLGHGGAIIHETLQWLWR
ncbi:MAG: alpha/beta hydrolase-fold protein [Pseudomonadota bacterium]